MYDALGSPTAYPADVSRKINPGGGKTFFVSGLGARPGSNSNEGTDPQFPLLTIQAGVNKCGQRNHDYVFVQDSYQEDVTTITINKRNVHLIGLGDGNPLSGRAVVDMQGTGACFTMTGSGGSLELAGFKMGSVGESCIVCTEVTHLNHIHHNSFGHFMPSVDGIQNSGFEMDSWLIDHNIFTEMLTGDAIRQAGGGPSWSQFNHNFFKVGPAAAGIVLASGVLESIIGNIFASRIADALAEGWAINMGVATEAAVMGNKASAAGNDAGNNPYKDGSSDNVATLKNAWADNFDGPALSGGPATA